MGRAITDSAKEEKAKLILNTASELLENGTFKNIKMIDIAKSCGVSKGTLFNYYSTKEKLFLEIYKIEFGKRVANLNEIFIQYEKLDYHQFKKIILEEMDNILVENSVLIKLSILINLTLEENIDYETALHFKEEMYKLCYQLGKLISDKVEFLTIDDVMDILKTQHAIIVGFRNLANVPSVIKKVVEERELEGFKIKFRKSALKAMTYYLDGLHQDKKEQSKSDPVFRIN